MICFLYRYLGLVILWVISLNVAHAEEKWIADEIFIQISEMRKEIQQLQKKVGELEQKLDSSEEKLKPISLNGLKQMTLGKQDATIAILEFSDYECPYCGKHYKNVLPKLRERYIDKGKVKYVMKDFPLDFHANAKKASLSARCAGEQGQYWAMHDAIFDAHGQVTDDLVNGVVKEKRLNSLDFNKCLENPAQLTSIQKDIALGGELGVSGTPSFVVGTVKENQLINYKRLDGVQSFESFVSIIDGFNNKN